MSEQPVEPRGQPDQPDHRLAWALGLTAVVATLLLSRGGLPPYDDAFFFGRFARNLLDHGVYAWNLADGPVHGNTSQLFQVLVTGVAAAAGDYTVSATRAALGLCLVVAGLALGRGDSHRLAAALAFTSPVALATAVSGMETALALALGALFVGSLSRAGRGATALSAGLAVALFTARPDTALLTLGSLGLLGIADGRLAPRRLLPAAAALGGMLLALLVYRLGYGTALPLSFYLKSGLTTVYDPEFLAICRESKLRHFLFFAVTTAPLWLLAARRPTRSWRLVAPAALFLSYHLAFTVDVMGLFGRFFAPALPWLAGAAALNLRDHLARGSRALLLGGWALLGLVIAGLHHQGLLPDDSGWAIGRAPIALYVGAWAVGLALIPGAPRLVPRGAAVLLIAGVAAGLSAPGPRWRAASAPTDSQLAEALIVQTTSWRGLPQLKACLGEDLHIYHSEIGVPGVLLPRAHITDLGGLMNPALALEGESADASCLRDQPDALFLPHRNYATLNASLARGACLEAYTRVVKKSSSPLFVRTDRLAEYRCR